MEDWAWMRVIGCFGRQPDGRSDPTVGPFMAQIDMSGLNITSREADLGSIAQREAVIAGQAPIADKDRKVFVSNAYIT